jgi:predicted ABC-type ATPase
MTEDSPRVIALAGPNGAGKTTLAPVLLRDQWKVLEYVNADPIALGLSGFDPGSTAFAAGRVMLKRLHDLAMQRRTFAFESTLSAKSYSAWLERLQREGFDFQLVFLWLKSANLAVQRVRERVRVGGHHVPEEIIHRRYQGGLRNFWRLYQPLANRWAVYDNSGSTNPIMVAEGIGTETKIIVPESWRQMREMSQ